MVAISVQRGGDTEKSVGSLDSSQIEDTTAAQPFAFCRFLR